LLADACRFLLMPAHDGFCLHASFASARVAYVARTAWSGVPIWMPSTRSKQRSLSKPAGSAAARRARSGAAPASWEDAACMARASSKRRSARRGVLGGILFAGEGENGERRRGADAREEEELARPVTCGLARACTSTAPLCNFSPTRHSAPGGGVSTHSTMPRGGTPRHQALRDAGTARHSSARAGSSVPRACRLVAGAVRAAPQWQPPTCDVTGHCDLTRDVAVTCVQKAHTSCCDRCKECHPASLRARRERE
jgi:hypothetical protein